MYNPRSTKILLFKDMKIGSIYSVVELNSIGENFLVEMDSNVTTKQFNIGSKIPEERQLILDLLENYRNIFGDSMSQLSRAIGVEHEINLTTEEPIKLRSYKHSPKEKQIIRDQVKEMLENGVIEESQSPYSAPVVLAKKKNGKIRFCIDYRKLNDITIKDRHPLPLIADTINLMTNSKYFSVMDLMSGYWNVKMKEEDKPKTAFITPDALYQWKVMPFGLSNAPATFQRYMQKVLQKVLYQFVVVYLDDLLVFSETLEDHHTHLKKIFEIIKKNNLKLSIEKCNFLCSQVKYLGHIISSNGIRPDEDKLKSVENFPIPKKVKDVQSFLGLANYYRIFVEKYAYIANPLTNLLRKNVKFEWTSECDQAFKKLKTKLIQAPILAQFKEDCEVEIFTDACMYGMSAILGQIQNNKHVVISYNSKMFNGAQLNYSVTEKECLALVYAVKKYRHYIYGTHFTLYSDHNPLQHIMKIKNPNGRLTRWSLILMEYDFTVVYKPGKNHQNADALSRYPYEKPDDKDEEITLLLNSTLNIPEAQSKDEWCKTITNSIKNGGKINQKFVIENNVLYRKTFDSNHQKKLLVCLPKLLRKQILRDFHDSEIAGAHLGFLKTYLKVKSRFFWPNCEKSIRKYVNNCESCQLNKGDRKAEKGLLQPIDVKFPFECIGVDILGPITSSSKGCKYIIIMIDLFTKWLETKAIRNTRSETLAKWFCEEIITRHGAIDRVLTDNARYFTSEFLKLVFELTTSKHIKSTPYSPQTNGNAEKACGIVKDMLKHYVKQNLKDWATYLPQVTFCYNISVHKTTRYSPFYLLYYREPRVPIDISMNLPRDFNYGIKLQDAIEDCRELVKLRIQDSQHDHKGYYDQKRRDVEFNEGDLVSLYTPHTEVGLSKKFLSQKTGPFKIVKKHSPLNYTIQKVDNPNKSEKVHIRRLIKWNKEQIPEIDRMDNKQNGPNQLRKPSLEKQLTTEVKEAENSHKSDNSTDNGEN